MPLINRDVLTSLQSQRTQIRNICILAHVDHGKTTLADSLVASNGIISQRMAGKMRYMDSRPDEQERGITMKSSCISLLYQQKAAEAEAAAASVEPDSGGPDAGAAGAAAAAPEQFIINLIDSPGHVDFSSEVSTAVRLCDGAIVLVDCVEGVCPQTRICLRQAYTENLKPILVLNKIDRLISEKKMTPFDAYVHLSQVLEQVNVVVGHLHAASVHAQARPDADDQTTGLEDADDSALYFAPAAGNVLFCSAVDGWAFTVHDFARLYAPLLGTAEPELAASLWGDFYWHGKQKRIAAGAQAKAKKPLAVQFIFETIWQLYDLLLVRRDRERIPGVCEKLGIRLSPRDLRLTDARIQLQTIMQHWLPVERAVLGQVVRLVPHPGAGVSEERAEQLMCSTNQNFASLPPQTQRLREAFQLSEQQSDVTIVFISKMVAVSRALLPANRPKPLSRADLEERRVVARQRHLERLSKATEADRLGVGTATAEVAQVAELSEAMAATGLGGDGAEVKVVELAEKVEEKVEVAVEDKVAKAEEEDQCDDVLIAFARVFSGTLRRGDKVYVLMPKHDPRTIDPANPASSSYITEVTIDSLYLLMGRELEDLDSAPAGNIIGIGGLQQHVFKTATLSTTPWCPSFCELSIMATPILRVAVEPRNALDLPRLMRGLRILNQADACVQVIIQENGEVVLLTLGEVHLERCVADLQQTYAKCALNVSPPIVSFRETVVPVATVDMVNESIVATKAMAKDKWVTVQTANKASSLRLIALPLGDRASAALQESADILKALHAKQGAAASLADRTRASLRALRTELSAALDEQFGKRFAGFGGESGEALVDRLWAVGPKKCATNVLLNLTDFKHRSVWSQLDEVVVEEGTLPTEKAADARADVESSFLNGFELSVLAGPLVEEQMHGVCFVLGDWTIEAADSLAETATAVPAAAALSSYKFGPFSGQIMSAVKDGCRQAFQAQPHRLVMPMYSCSIVVSADVLGKMYAVIGRRHGKVLSADLTAGSDNFTVESVLPVIESLHFAQDIRKQTSGLAQPQLVFSHWETLELDPFWVPATEEEYLHYGDKADFVNRAKSYMDTVRRRKGLHVEDKLVEHAEKQRTLSKNK